MRVRFLQCVFQISRIHRIDLFCGNNPRLIEDKIIEYVDDMKKIGKGYSIIHNHASAVLAFYKINDVLLIVTKINRFIPVQKRVKKDRAYTREEILMCLKSLTRRTRTVILLMASPGIRLGALPLLKFSNLQHTKITVYENDREEYFTFITLEWNKVIDSYLDMRLRYGEKLDKDSFLIRCRRSYLLLVCRYNNLSSFSL